MFEKAATQGGLPLIIGAASMDPIRGPQQQYTHPPPQEVANESVEYPHLPWHYSFRGGRQHQAARRKGTNFPP